MRFGTAPLARRLLRIRRPPREGGGAVACAVAAPLVVLGLALTADYASVSRFRTRVQRAADAASLAAAAAIVRNPDQAGRSDVDNLANRVAATVFVSRAPRGAAGTPTVAAKSRAAFVTTTVGYAGVAPSNFGSALGYDSVSVNASAISLAGVADSRLTAER